MTITRAQAFLLLEPKLSNIWHEAYPSYPLEYPSFLNIRETRKAQVTDYKISDFGPLRLKGEGENIIYDDPLFGSPIVYTPVRFALGYKITDETIKHELYGQVEKFERALMASAIDMQETTAALVLNNGFTTTDADGFEASGFDGLQFFSTAHTQLGGGAVARNRPTTDVDLSVTGLQNAITDFATVKNDRGRPQKISPSRLIIGPGDMFTARELLQSEYKPGTANNEINALRSENLSFFVSHYLTDADAWYLAGDTHDANFIWEERPRGGMEEDFDAEVIKRKIVEGFASGHGEWRGYWGTSGG